MFGLTCLVYMQLFPYHLSEYVCRVLRVTPFRYYCDLLYTVMREEKSYDQIPNFAVRPFLLVVLLHASLRALHASLRDTVYELAF